MPKPDINFELNEDNKYLTVTIDTERLHMESVTINYLTDNSYPSLFSSSVNMANFATGQAWDITATKQRMDVWVKRWQSNDPFSSLAVSDNDTDQFIGHVTLGYGDAPGSAELIYVFDNKYWGKGYGKESVTAVVKDYVPALAQRKYQINKKEFTSVVATVRDDNIGSIKILERCGMVKKPDTAQENKAFGHTRQTFFVNVENLISQTLTNTKLVNKETIGASADSNIVQRKP